MTTLAQVRGTVDFAILTIRPDEYTAILANFSPRTTVLGSACFYEYCRVKQQNGNECGVAVRRVVDQGQGAAQEAARNAIEDLDPCCLMLVGIAGGVPDAGFSLGDVLLASRFYDVTVSAEILNKETHDREWDPTGGPVHPDVEALLGAVVGWKGQLKGWNAKKNVRQNKPVCEVPADITHEKFSGSEDYRKKLKESLDRHFPAGKRVRNSQYTVKSLMTGNTLVKDSSLAEEWKRLARSYGFVEMEAGGVYRAARRPYGEYPVLVIRGLSDIIGFKRDEAWTAFACHTAAAFAAALIRSGLWKGTKPVKPADVAAGGLPTGTSPSVSYSPGGGVQAADMERLTFAEIDAVTKFVLENPAQTKVDFSALDPDEKLKRNGLSRPTRDQLVMGLSKVHLVTQYVEHQLKLDIAFPEKLKAGFLKEYRRLKENGIDGDPLFDGLVRFGSKGTHDRLYQAATLAVLSYLFEICDVFER
jgi:nucleoside phosphorylase